MFGFFKKLFGKKDELHQLISQGAIIVDVRTPREFNAGHIKGSKNIPLELLKGRLQELKKFHKPIITVCQSGMRSSTAKSFLQSQGLQVANGGSWSGLNNIL